MKNTQKYIAEEISKEFTKEELITASEAFDCWEFPQSYYQKKTKIYLARYILCECDSSFGEDVDIIEWIENNK